MKRRDILDFESCEDQSIDWEPQEESNHSGLIMPAGFIDCSDYTEQPTGQRLTELQDLDMRLRRHQTLKEREALYQEILERGERGDGFALGAGNSLQGHEFNCVETNWHEGTIRSMRAEIEKMERSVANSGETVRNFALDIIKDLGNPRTIAIWTAYAGGQSQKDVAKSVRCSVGTVNETLHNLAARGIVRIRQRGGVCGSNRKKGGKQHNTTHRD